MARLTLIVTPRGIDCPLVCDYCYNSDPFLQQRLGSGRMDNTLSEVVLRKFLSFEQRRYEIIWHGGEPLLAGISFYKKVVEQQETIANELEIKAPIVNHLQTSGVLINQAWVDFFKREGFKVGVSIDGPPTTHDAHRFYPNGRGSQSDALRGAKLLKENGVSVGVGAVITKKSMKDPIGLFEYMRENFSVFDFSPCFTAITSEGKWVQEIAPMEYAQFVKIVFDHWFEVDDPKIRIRTFRHYVQAVLGHTPRTCSMDSGCHKFMSVDGDGNVYPCGRLHGLPELQFGSIKTQGFVDVQSRVDYLSYIEQANSQSDDCLICKWQYVCNNGCTAARYTETGEILAKTPFCEATKEILEHVSSRVNTVKE